MVQMTVSARYIHCYITDARFSFSGKYREYRNIKHIMIFLIFSIFWYFRKYNDIFQPCRPLTMNRWHACTLLAAGADGPRCWYDEHRLLQTAGRTEARAVVPVGIFPLRHWSIRLLPRAPSARISWISRRYQPGTVTCRGWPGIENI